MSLKPIFAEKEDCKKNWHEIPADFSIKVLKILFYIYEYRQIRKTEDSFAKNPKTKQ